MQGDGGEVQLAAAKEIAARLSAAKEPGVAAEGKASARMPGSSSSAAGTTQEIEDIELGEADLLMTDEQADASLGEAAATGEAEEEAQPTGEAMMEDVEEAEEEAEQLEALRVGELRAKLGERGLATEGRKAELVTRLREVLLEEARQLGGDETLDEIPDIPAWYPASPSHPTSPPPPSAPPSPPASAEEEAAEAEAEAEAAEAQQQVGQAMEQEAGQEAGEAGATPARRAFTSEDVEREERLQASERAVKAAIGEAEDDEAEEAEEAEEGAGGAADGGEEGGGGSQPSMPVVVEEEEEEDVMEGVEQEAAPRPPPILVLCVTNHALDQVLEGILPFESSVVRVGGRSKSVALKEKNLQPLLEAKRACRSGPIKNVLRSLSAETRHAKARLASSLSLVQAAHGTGPLDGGGTVLDGSMLRDIAELRGSLGTELRGMRRDAMAAWLSGTRDDMRDEMNSAELRQCCDDAERRHHHLRGEEEGGEASGDRGFVWTLSPPQRARLHNTMLSAVRVRAVLKLEEEMRAYRQLMLAVRHVS